MENLIAALLIFAKYIPNETNPTYCEHDELHIQCSPRIVSDEDILILDDYGFISNGDEFISFKYGNC